VAHATEPPSTRASLIAEIKLNLAKAGANEATLYNNTSDMDAIWQVTTTVARRFGRGLEAILEAQQRLSPRLTGIDPRPGRFNLVWSRNLQWSDEEPEGWDESMPWSTVVEQGLWRNTREHAAMLVTELVRHQRRPRVCRGVALAWGGPGLDEEHLARRNEVRERLGKPPLVHLDCGLTRNFFVGLPQE
jgi:hypothetical protein